jgi:hypothetical protein
MSRVHASARSEAAGDAATYEELGVSVNKGKVHAVRVDGDAFETVYGLLADPVYAVRSRTTDSNALNPHVAAVGRVATPILPM